MATITRSFEVFGDRYKYDFIKCRFADGWAQLDTRQDAAYYGNWINPLTLKLFSYCEGDTTLTECEDEAEFIATVQTCAAWHKEHGYFVGIDAYGQDGKIAAEFVRIGLGELLHGVPA